eukprot:286337_1
MKCRVSFYNALIEHVDPKSNEILFRFPKNALTSECWKTLVNGKSHIDSDNIFIDAIKTHPFQKHELNMFENAGITVIEMALNGKLKPESFHISTDKNGVILKVKSWFGDGRYLWTEEHRSNSKDFNFNHGVRADCDPIKVIPELSKLIDLVEKYAKLRKGFINGASFNCYKEYNGLGNHYDDANRFEAPITSVSVFADGRLAYGAKIRSLTDAEFYTNLEEGALFKMGPELQKRITHCVRPIDITAIRGSWIFRHYHKHLIKIANNMPY